MPTGKKIKGDLTPTLCEWARRLGDGIDPTNCDPVDCDKKSLLIGYLVDHYTRFEPTEEDICWSVRIARKAGACLGRCHFYADAERLAKFNAFKERYGIKHDAEAIRLIVRTAFNAAGDEYAVKNKKPQQELLFK